MTQQYFVFKMLYFPFLVILWNFNFELLFARTRARAT